MKRYMAHILVSAEKITEHFLKVQVHDEGTLADGGMEGLVVDVKPTVFALRAAMSVYLYPQSRFYKDETLRTAMEQAIDFVARNQNEGGSFDYTVCNFHSAPDTAFCYHPMDKTYRLMKKFEYDVDTSSLQEKYLAIMKKAAAAIRDGGFHTPNHRWAICAALMQAADVFAPDESFAKSCKARTEKYFNEGIDGNADGEYAERSTGGYNCVVNDAMINLYEMTKNKEYLSYPEKNLHMMELYFEPDGTIFTQNSTRQDRGKKVWPDLYFHQYLYMATRGNVTGEHRDEFLRAAHQIIRSCIARGDDAPDCLYLLMLYEQMAECTLEGSGFIKKYRKLFSDSGVLRVARENYAYTALKGKTAFLYVNVNGMDVCFKIGESFCEVRNFVAQQLIQTEDGCELTASANVWYYEPWEEKPNTSDWWQMDQKKRSLKIPRTLTTKVTIHEHEDGLEITLHTEGLEKLPLRLQLCIPAGTVVRNDAFWLKTEAGQGMIVRSGDVELALGEKILSFGPCFGEHEFQGHYSGEETNAGGYTIFCNALTPVDKTVFLRVKRK